MPRTVYYLTTTGKAAALADPGLYARHGLTPLVLLAGNGTNVYRPGWDAEAAVAEARRQVEGPMLVALWCDNVARDEKPGGSTLFPWDDDAGWSVLLGNLVQLRAACERHGVSGVVWDGEIYTSTPHNNGGLMGNAGWPGGARAKERGRAVREALGSLTLGQYALVRDAVTRPGWKPFWAGAYRAGDLLLDESGYLGGDWTQRWKGRGVRNVPGRGVKGDRFQGGVPRGDFWIYDWNSQPAFEVLSRKWRAP